MGVYRINTTIVRWEYGKKVGHVGRISSSCDELYKVMRGGYGTFSYYGAPTREENTIYLLPVELLYNTTVPSMLDKEPI